MIAVMALLAVMCLFIICNTRTLSTLKRELRLIETKQQQHWAQSQARQP